MATPHELAGLAQEAAAGAHAPPEKIGAGALYFTPGPGDADMLRHDHYPIADLGSKPVPKVDSADDLLVASYMAGVILDRRKAA